MLRRNYLFPTHPHLGSGSTGLVVALSTEQDASPNAWVDVLFSGEHTPIRIQRARTKVDHEGFRATGSRSMLPLIEAAGMTIHKSQSLTLEKVVVHCTRNMRPHMFSVAVGRCSNRDGLRLVAFDRTSIVADAETLKFYTDLETQQRITMSTWTPNELAPPDNDLYQLELERALVGTDFGSSWGAESPGSPELEAEPSMLESPGSPELGAEPSMLESPGSPELGAPVGVEPTVEFVQQPSVFANGAKGSIIVSGGQRPITCFSTSTLGPLHFPQDIQEGVLYICQRDEYALTTSNWRDQLSITLGPPKKFETAADANNQHNMLQFDGEAVRCDRFIGTCQGVWVCTVVGCKSVYPRSRRMGHCNLHGDSLEHITCTAKIRTWLAPDPNPQMAILQIGQHSHQLPPR